MQAAEAKITLWAVMTVLAFSSILTVSCDESAQLGFAEAHERDEGAESPFAAGAAACAPQPRGCGDGEVAPDEECDPAAQGWSEHCSDTCKRTSYRACKTHAECGAPNANCAAIRGGEASQFCADFCTEDASCPTLPGYESACNFAWCSVVCKDGRCPNGMVCAPDFPAVNSQGEVHGTRDVCVIESDVRSELSHKSPPW